MSPTRDTRRSGGMQAFPGAPPNRRAGLVTLGLAVALTLPLAATPALAGAQAAQAGSQGLAPDAKLRAKDLGVLEQLLVEAVEDAVTDQILAINEEVRQSQVEAQQTGEPPRYRYRFRSAGEAGARGLFLEDYGVIFTVQVPHVSHSPTPSLTISRSSSPDFPIPVRGGSSEALVALEQARELQLRSQISVLEQNLARIERMLQQETASESTSGLARQMTAHIAELEEMRTRLAEELRAEGRDTRAARVEEWRQETGEREAAEAAGERQAAETAEEREAAEAAEERARRERRAVVAAGSPWARLMVDPEVSEEARKRAAEQEKRIEQALITGIIDTMARYGTVIHGLEDDDRVAVVLQPSSYLSDVQRWLRATDRAEEFVVSVRYRDIVALEDDDIDAEEFGRRIRVESRLGQPRVAIQPPDSR